MVLGPGVPSQGLSVGDSGRRDLLSLAEGSIFHSCLGLWKHVGLASEGAQILESGLSTEVVETIIHSRAPSM